MQKSGEQTSRPAQELFGLTAEGQEVQRITLVNRTGSRARLITYGATLTELHVPDAHGQHGDIVLGFDNLKQYETDSPYFGCTAGRVANRIGNGRFSLNGVVHQLATNAAPHHLHGGDRGLDKVVWKAEPYTATEGSGVVFRYRSPDGEEGYPGTLDLQVTYFLTDSDELRIEYRATTDQATPVNLTHHSYFNLAGPASGTILAHQLEIRAHRYTVADESLLPTGEIAPVAGTPFDFTEPREIGSRIDQVEGGYDLNYAIDRVGQTSLTLAAVLSDRSSGRRMEILTTEPGIQFYTGNFLDGSITGKEGVVYGQHAGVCLETQHYPDSPNRPEFPSIILKPGETYHHVIVHVFSTTPDPGT